MITQRSGTRSGWYRSHGERGLTLIELLIAMVMTTIIVGAVLGLMISQSRFTDDMRASAMQLDQVRSASNFLGTEITDLTRGGVTHAGEDSIQYRVALSWGVVCGDKNQKAKTKTKETEESLVDSAAIYLEPLPQALGAPGPAGFAVSTDGWSWEFHAVSDWAGLDIVQDTIAKNACLSDAGAQSAETDMYARFDKLTNYVDTLPSEGMIIYSYYDVSYFFRTLTGTEGLVLYRGVDSAAQKLAWPFGESAGFAYRLADGSEVTTVSGASLPLIRAIQLKLPARREKRRDQELDTLEFHPWIRLRNSR